MSHPSRTGASVVANRSPRHAPEGTSQLPTPDGQVVWREDDLWADRPHGHAYEHPSHDVGAHQSRPSQWGNRTLQDGHGMIPSGNRDRDMTPSRTPVPPGVTSPAEALSQVQMLLDFPPRVDQMDTWRATIKSLVEYVDQGRRGGASSRHQPTDPTVGTRHQSQGPATSAQSPQCPPHVEPRGDRDDPVSVASFVSRRHQDQYQTLRDRQGQDACVRIERCKETRRRSDPRADLDDVKHSDEDMDDLPCGVGCATFTLELRCVKWPRHFRPDLSVQYDGKTNPIEFLGIYTIAIVAVGGKKRA